VSAGARAQPGDSAVSDPAVSNPAASDSSARAFATALEPAGLLAAFLAYPPEGFALLHATGVSDLAFAADLDLLTTADAALTAQVRGLPGYAWWGRCLRVRTAFIGTTVSEYFPQAVADACGLASSSMPALLPQGRVAAWRTMGAAYRLLVVKDLPCASPLLDAQANHDADALAQACVEAGFVLLEGQQLAYVAIDFSSVDAYLARLSASRRKNIRRKLRSRADLDVTCLPTGSAVFDDASMVDSHYALYLNVYAQSDIHFDLLPRAFFAHVLRDAASGGIVFAYRHAGELIGFNLCFEHGGKLIDKYVGFAYPQARTHNLYAVSWMMNLEHALARGLTHYVAGWTDPQVKAELGASFTPTRHAVHVRNPLLRGLARRFAHRFEADRVWKEEAGKTGPDACAKVGP
jgi:hypothetical protein